MPVISNAGNLHFMLMKAKNHKIVQNAYIVRH